MRLSQFDIGWLVGLVEGDGTFTFDGKYPTVVLSLTDKDTAERFARLLGCTVHGPYHYEGQQLGNKPRWMARICGKRAREFMSSTAHHFSARRQEQIRSLIGDQTSLIDQHATTEAA